MRFVLWNVLLALNWALLIGRFDLSSLASGFVLGFVLLWLLREALGTAPYFHRLRHAAVFAFGFLVQLVQANLTVARSVLLKRVRDIRPAFVAVPLEARTDAEIALLANLITLTPGTLSIDVSDDRSVLYIHTLDVDDLESLRREIRSTLERPLLEALR